MRFRDYVIVIGIVVVVVYVVRFIPQFQPQVQPSTSASPEFFVYIDADDNGNALMTDIAGTSLEETLVTHHSDRIIIVNRMAVQVTVGSDPGLFAPGQQSLNIGPSKRKICHVIGTPGNEYSLTLTPAGGPINPPKVKVGEDP